MQIKLSEIAGFEESISYTFDEEAETILIRLGEVEELVDLSGMAQQMVDIEYDEEKFNALRPIVAAERDGAGELRVEVLWLYSGVVDKIKLENEWNGADDLWLKLYQKQSMN